MSDEIEIYGQKPLTVQEVVVHIKLLQEVLEKVMKKGQHYDTIPGTSKPTLLKPGAEKILATFRLGVDPIVEDLSNGDILRYRVKCNIKTFNGIFVGAGVGEASSEEEKYKWRSIVSEKEWEATPENMRKIKYTRDKNHPTIQQIRTNPYDIANTILKMAKKRAMVDGTLTVTAASDIFTQDIEDMPEEIVTREVNPESKQEPKSEPIKKSVIKEPNDPAIEPQIIAIRKLLRNLNWKEEEYKKTIGHPHFHELTQEQAGNLIKDLQEMKKKET